MTHSRLCTWGVKRSLACYFWSCRITPTCWLLDYTLLLLQSCFDFAVKRWRFKNVVTCRCSVAAVFGTDPIIP